MPADNSSLAADPASDSALFGTGSDMVAVGGGAFDAPAVQGCNRVYQPANPQNLQDMGRRGPI